MNLMNDISHRPWPLPSKNWILRQTWNDLLFVHYPIPVELLRPHIPGSLQIDTFDGTAWLGVVVFVMEGIYFRGLAAVSLTPKFTEINVRTYVHCNGKPGVYFMSLDVGNLASLLIAKKWYRLPYQPAQISIQKEGESFYCQSLRKGKMKIPIAFEGKYVPLSEVYLPEKGTVDHWLTERYCFFSTNKRGSVFCGEIHHRPWPLQKVKAEIVRNTLFTPFQVDVEEEKTITHFSMGVEAFFWNIKRIK
ncbi:YqjF family protein [Bacillus sp. EB600]|uniref:YqjF family protein n=1 Tax=Bacillus sp. EB600 TaxID=2806345 RepID=UPI00210E7149|nr:DUF2071 domain-containing protein [Bacillus sp. EB600]MCQ6278424.1 DUF2071 domain-containing protein [Bacillus sp. EB600]